MSAPRPQRPDSYERLEFLGDRVLGLAVAAYDLSSTFPARARASCRAGSPRSCARRPAPKSRETGASARIIRLGEGEAQTGGAQEARDPRRHLRGDHRRGFPRRRRPMRRSASCAPLSAPKCIEARAQSARRQDAPCRNGRRRAACRRRAIGWSARSGPDHAPSFELAVEVEGFAPRDGDGTLEARRRTGRRRRLSWRARA